MEKYDPKEIEKKWQKEWEKKGIFKAVDPPLREAQGKLKPKFYALDMFPYPSGEGLHVGHPKGYVATDVVSRFKMMQGFNVLHPMGWDAFGLPAENFAIKHKIHPAEAVRKNIKRFREQIDKIGFTYDWSRETNTTDPEYYKWTQWIFLQMFKKGLAYQSFEPVIWCPSCKTVLAQEDLEGDVCERCGSEVERKPMKQWVLKMTAYADRLLSDLKLVDWEDSIIEQQKNWIGRSEGAQFDMPVKIDGKETQEKISVYTTRIDTVFGITYAVVAPEHQIISKLKNQILNIEKVEKYIKESRKKSELERTELAKEKTGIELEGIKVINPFNDEEVPLFVGDYVLGYYGTGAVMAVPAHDERDFDFAKKHNLPIKQVIIPNSNPPAGGPNCKLEEAYEEDGVLINSNDFDGLTSTQAREKMAQWLAQKGVGDKKVNYKMHDWVFSRQRYWGEPIPLVFCEKCGVVPVPEKDLPVKLPEVERYEPTGTGESPLAAIENWVNVKCPKCGGEAKRETNTMPQWAGSCWYYLRYIDPKNNQALVDKQKEKYWQPVDLYVGGAEHATRHLLYARFWHKFLYDIGVVSTLEPFQKLVHVGLILAEDGRKMSKRWGNVINPDDVVEKFGADAFRMYEMFMGPFTQAVAWSTSGVMGVRRFLEKLWDMRYSLVEGSVFEKVEFGPDCENKTEERYVKKIIHQTIKKVTDDIEGFRFNTAISSLMILLNNLRSEKSLVTKDQFELFLKLLAPFAPHVIEEIWREKLGHKESIFLSEWPKYDPELAKEEEIELIIQVNGVVRDRINAPADISQDAAEKLALESQKIQKYIAGKKIKKMIFVKGRLVNIVI